MKTLNYNSPQMLPVFNKLKTVHNNSPLLFLMHVPCIFSLLFITNKRTINTTTVSLYIILHFSTFPRHHQVAPHLRLATIRYTPRLSTLQTSTLRTSPRGKSTIKYIQYVHDILSLYPYTNFHFYCRVYTQPQIHTAGTRYYIVEQILL